MPRVLLTVCITSVAACSTEEAPEIESVSQEAVVSDFYYSS